MAHTPEGVPQFTTMKIVALTQYRAKLATLDARAKHYGGKRLTERPSIGVLEYEMPDIETARRFATMARLDDARHVTVTDPNGDELNA